MTPGKKKRFPRQLSTKKHNRNAFSPLPRAPGMLCYIYKVLQSGGPRYFILFACSLLGDEATERERVTHTPTRWWWWWRRGRSEIKTYKKRRRRRENPGVGGKQRMKNMLIHSLDSCWLMMERGPRWSPLLGHVTRLRSSSGPSFQLIYLYHCVCCSEQPVAGGNEDLSSSTRPLFPSRVVVVVGSSSIHLFVWCSVVCRRVAAISLDNSQTHESIWRRLLGRGG